MEILKTKNKAPSLKNVSKTQSSIRKEYQVKVLPLKPDMRNLLNISLY